MKDSLKNVQNLAICIVILAALTFAAYFVAPLLKPTADSGLDTSAAAQGIRFLFMGIGALLVLGVCYFTRESEAWEINPQKIVYMAIGAVIYGVFAWIFSGQTFNLPALSQVSLRPAIVLPVFFGYTFGPLVGFMVGAGGNLIGDLFVGGVSPHWTLANGLIGLIAGMTMLYKDKKQAWEMAAMIVGLGGITATGFFLANSGSQIQLPDSTFAQPSILMGLSVLLGCSLAIALRFVFPNRLLWAEAVILGATGNIIGLALASMADVWVNNFSLMDAMIGEFIPAAGPNIIAVVILTPLLLVVYAAAAQQAEA